MNATILALVFAVGINLASFAAQCRAQVSVTADVSVIAGSGYRYNYTVTNIGSTPISAFSIELGGAPSNTAAPTGWVVQILTTSERRIVQWVASSASSDLQPSSVLAGFSISSTNSPGTVSFGAIDETPIVYDNEPTTGPAFIPSQLADISTRLQVRTGDNVLIAGFIIAGTHKKTVLIRGIGPSLAAAGLSGLLPDPTLELHDSSGQVIATNDNWHESSGEQEIIDSGIPPSDDKEAAILLDLSPGAYTAIIRDANAGSGVGLVEVYDLDRVADSKLANISTRGLVSTGDDVMIGGTIILGSTPARVLIRAIGPSLTNFGVPNALQDPTLELHNDQGDIIASNDNWVDSPDAAAISATAIQPTDNRESAILQNLAPGAYTAIVRGSGNSTGVAVVEAYQLQ